MQHLRKPQVLVRYVAPKGELTNRKAARTIFVPKVVRQSSRFSNARHYKL